MMEEGVKDEPKVEPKDDGAPRRTSQQPKESNDQNQNGARRPSDKPKDDNDNSGSRRTSDKPKDDSGARRISDKPKVDDNASETEIAPKPSTSKDEQPLQASDSVQQHTTISHALLLEEDPENDGIRAGSLKKTYEQELAEAAEHRKLWAMAATSVANLIKEFSDKPIPNLEAIRQSFEPETPAEWVKRREAAAEAEIDEFTLSVQVDNTSVAVDETTDPDLQTDLFYDTDANDDDLQDFLGSSDQKITGSRKSARPRASQQLDLRRKSLKQAAAVEKAISIVRKSLPVLGIGRKSSDAEEPPGMEDINESPLAPKKASSASLAVPEEGQEGGDEGDNAEELQPRESKPRLSALALQAMESTDDDDWDYDDKPPDVGLLGADDPDVLFQVTDLDYDINELAKGLESLLQDLQLESRITERYRYKLANKYNLLLHALVGTHDREYEIMQHLQTKHKILTVLNNFVKSEAEVAAKLLEEKTGGEEDLLDEEEGKFVDDDQDDDEEGENEGGGLSIEEMKASTIRDTLLRQKNKIDVLEATKKIHVLKLKQKEFERTLLTLHYSKMVKPIDLNKEIKDARRLVNELQVDISALHQEMGQLQTDIRIQEKAVNTEEKQVEKLELDALTKQGEVAILQNKPLLIQKEADRVGDKLEQLQDTYQHVCQKQLDNMDNFRSFSGRSEKLEHELNILIREEAKMAQQKKNAIRDVERLMGQMEALITREQIMIDKAAQMNDKVSQANKLKKRIQDEQQKVANEASKAVRVTLRLERSIKLASEAFLNARLAHEKMRTAFDAAKPSEEDSNWQRLSRMLEREIANLKNSLDKRLEESAIKGSMVDRLKQKLSELYDDQVASGKELQELIRTTVRKRREREEKSEQCIKLDSQIQKFDNDVKMRELIIGDCQRSCKDLARQVEVVQSKIGTVKLEKSTVVNDITINKEKLAEARSIFKGLENDMKVIAQRILDLEKAIKDQHYLILNARLARDSVRSDTLRSRDKFRYHRNQKDELILGNKTLRRDLLRQKVDIAKIRKDFEDALTASSSIAMSVRERLEEICTFMEYIHTYDKILLKGAEEITVRELERTKLCSLQDELRKHVLIVKRNQPDETEFVSKIERLRKEFYEVTEKRRALEMKMNEDDNPERVREIKFDLMKTRENIPALERKLDTVEELLAYTDVIGLERTLIENHVAKITDDLLANALHLKDTYGKQVKLKVSLRKNLGQISREIDGLICENSIASAQAETSETMFMHFQKQLAEAEANFAQGLPPTKEMEEEWNHLQWRKEMLRRANHRPPGFLRQIKHKESYQVNAERIRAGCCKRRQLEDPKDSILGWSFSAESAYKARGQSAPQPMELIFNNSALNPRRSCVERRQSRVSITNDNKRASTPTKQKTSLPKQKTSLQERTSLQKQKTSLQERTSLTQQRTSLTQQRASLSQQRTSLTQQRASLTQQRTSLPQQKTSLPKQKTSLSFTM